MNQTIKNNTIPFGITCVALVVVTLSAVSTVRAAVSTFADGVVVGGTGLTSGLLLEVEGRIGATEICNESGSECSDVSNIYTTVLGGGGGGGTLDGSGTANYLPKFTAATTLGNSVIRENGPNIGIGRNPSQMLDVNGNIIARSGNVYLGSGAAQSLYGDNGSAVYYDSNHSTVTQIILRDAENSTYGRLYGDGNTANFGLLDRDGNWAIRHTTDSSTSWYINNSQRMILTTSGLSVTGSVTAGDFIYTSDQRLKTNIKTLSGLDVVGQLRGVNFDWKSNGQTNSGFIAQEVETVAPELVVTDEQGMKAVKYGNITAYLVEAIKEQQVMINQQQQEIDQLRTMINQ